MTARRATHQPARRRTRLNWDTKEILASLVVALAVAVITLWFVVIATDEPPVSAPSSSSAAPTLGQGDVLVVIDEDGAPVEVLPMPQPGAPDTEPEPEPPVAEHPEWAPDGMGPCQHEDSADCYWDATAQGNGIGRSFIDRAGAIEYIDGQPAPEAEPTPEAEDWPGMDWGTLQCGHHAKPAIDYDHDTGWWAYCEPALAD